jgi:hypothetical protein
MLNSAPGSHVARHVDGATHDHHARQAPEGRRIAGERESNIGERTQRDQGERLGGVARQANDQLGRGRRGRRRRRVRPVQHVAESVLTVVGGGGQQRPGQRRRRALRDRRWHCDAA